MRSGLSFAGQMAIVLAVALLAAQSVNFLLLLRAQDRLEFARDSAAIERVVRNIDNVDRFDRWRRRQGRDREGGPRNNPFYSQTVVPAAASSEVDEGLTAALRETLEAAELNAEGALAARSSIPRGDSRVNLVMLSIPLEDGRWQNFGIPKRQEDRVSVRALAFQTILIYAGLLVPVLIVTARLSRPLARLTRAAETFRLDGDVTPLTPRGPSDVRHLTEAFERMRSRLLKLFTEKDVMLGAIGHDLRTPLTSLRIRVERVEDIKLREDMIGTIDELSLLLEDILTLARDGKPGTERTIIDAGKLANTVALELGGEAHGHIGVHSEGDLSVSGYEPLLRRALRNLVQNALRYGGDVSISAERSGDSVILAVEDNGPGLSPEDLERLREPFARGERSRNRATGGAGLGLAITDGAARAHDGRLVLENRPEGGLRAAIDLPAAF